jgi:hypothetical protein
MIRRNFIDSLIENHEGSMWFIGEFGKLFGVEYECRKLNLSPEDRLNYRKKHSVSIMDRIKKKLEEYFSSGYAGCGELFTKALKYARREGSTMEMVLENGGLDQGRVCQGLWPVPHPETYRQAHDFRSLYTSGR